MRRHLTFAVAGEACAATLDDAPGTTGLLIVSGGNETRAGPHRSMATLAAAFAAGGVPVLRFDRRGVGDSAGANGGYADSAPDIAAALALFRSVQPQLTRVVAFGNCDAASALVLHEVDMIDARVLGNPWAYEAEPEEPQTTEGDDAPAALPPAAAIAARYAAKLRDPRELLRLLRGEVSVAKLAWGLRGLLRTPAPVAPDGLGARLVAGLRDAGSPVTILLATGDRTAQRFAELWGATTGPGVEVRRRATASHGWAGEGDAAWLADRLREAIAATR